MMTFPTMPNFSFESMILIILNILSNKNYNFLIFLNKISYRFHSCPNKATKVFLS